MKNKSFTLIEILVVIVIIGILTGIVLFNTNDATEKRKRLEILTFSEGAKGKNLDSLVSEWTFDGPTLAGSSATNDDVKDSWGHNNASVSTTAPIVTSEEGCVSGKCLRFDGMSSVSIPTNSSFDIKSEVSIEGWFYLYSYSAMSASGYPILGQRDTFRFWQYASSGLPSCFVWEMYNDGTRRHYDLSLSLLPLNKWTHLTLIYGDGVSRVYQNGKLFGTKTVGVVENPLSTLPFFVGNQYYFGFLDEVRFYKKALSVSVIRKDYFAGLDLLLAKGLISEEEYDQRTLTLAQNE